MWTLFLVRGDASSFSKAKGFAGLARSVADSKSLTRSNLFLLFVPPVGIVMGFAGQRARRFDGSIGRIPGPIPGRNSAGARTTNES